MKGKTGLEEHFATNESSCFRGAAPTGFAQKSVPSRARCKPILLSCCLNGIFDGRDSRKFDVVELTVQLLDSANVFVLHYVAGL